MLAVCRKEPGIGSTHKHRLNLSFTFPVAFVNSIEFARQLLMFRSDVMGRLNVIGWSSDVLVRAWSNGISPQPFILRSVEQV
jgi:hypothetical protein